MIETTAEALARHLIEDLAIGESDLVFLFSGLWGLGKLAEGAETITRAFQTAIPKGVLMVPTFSYSWARGEAYDPRATPCPDMGAYGNRVWRDPRFVRTANPNFSVAALRNEENAPVVDALMDVDDDCFGDRSIFGNVLRYGRDRPAHILLLGGAFKDCLFRCTFIHHVQQAVGAPHRFIKSFADPAGSGRVVTQLCRYVTEEEFRAVNGDVSTRLTFPATEDFTPLGPDLEANGLLTRAPFAYYESRMAPVAGFCGLLAGRIAQDPYYCVTSLSP